MLKFLADEDLNNRILRGLVRLKPDLDIIRVQDTALSGMPDQQVIEWASQNDRVLITHDVSTMTHFAYQRVKSGQKFSGIIEVPQSLPVGKAIDDLLLIATVCLPDDFENRIEYLPL